MGKDDAFAILELFNQSHDTEGRFDRGNFAHEPSWNADFFRGLGVCNQNVGPGGATQDPLVMVHPYDGRVEGKTAVAQFGEAGGDERHRHQIIL